MEKNEKKHQLYTIKSGYMEDIGKENGSKYRGLRTKQKTSSAEKQLREAWEKSCFSVFSYAFWCKSLAESSSIQLENTFWDEEDQHIKLTENLTIILKTVYLLQVSLTYQMPAMISHIQYQSITNIFKCLWCKFTTLLTFAWT